MASSGGRAFVDSGSGVKLKDDGSEDDAPAGTPTVPTLPAGGSKPSEGLKVDELKAALDAKGLKYPEGAKKQDLADLLDGAQ